MSLTSKERVRIAISNEEPDRVPVFAGFVPTVERRLEEKYGKHEDDIGLLLGNDLIKTVVGIETSNNASDDPEYTCKWGVTFRNMKNEVDQYTEVIHHPLAGDESKLDSYQIPDPLEESQYDYVRKVVSKYGDSMWVLGSCQQSIFEASWYLRGLENLLVDMAINEDFVFALMDKVMQFPMQAGKKMIELGVDMIWLGDDISTQRGMMISLDMWRKYLKPRYAQLISEFKKARKDIVVAYHCCGNGQAIFGDMADIGLDVIHSLQPLCMDPVEIKKQYGDRLTLFGGMDIQRLMPLGTRDEIFREAERLMKGCGKGGGFIYSPAHYIQADTSVENIEAFYEAGKKYGTYPL